MANFALKNGRIKLLLIMKWFADGDGFSGVTLILTSLGLFFELVFPESTSEGSRPHMQGCSGWEGEKEEEGDLETEPIYHASCQSAKHQLPQHLHSCKKTVMSRLKGKQIEQRWMIGKERKVRGDKVTKRGYWEQSVTKGRE